MNEPFNNPLGPHGKALAFKITPLVGSMIIQMRKDGKSWIAIGKAVGLSKQRCQQWFARHAPLNDRVDGFTSNSLQVLKWLMDAGHIISLTKDPLGNYRAGIDEHKETGSTWSALTLREAIITAATNLYKKGVPYA